MHGSEGGPGSQGGKVRNGDQSTPSRVLEARFVFRTNSLTGVTLRASAIPLPEGFDKFSKIRIGRKDLAIDPDVVQVIADTVRATKRLEIGKRRVDCAIFAGMLLGERYKAQPQAAELIREIRFDDMSPTDSVGEVPPMIPLGLATVTNNGLYTVEHIVVRVSAEGTPDLYIGKLGDGDVVITDLPDIAAYYGTTAVGPLTGIRIVRADTGEIALDYRKKRRSIVSE